MVHAPEIAEKLKGFENPDWVSQRVKAFGVLSPARALGKRILAPYQPDKKNDRGPAYQMNMYGYNVSDELRETAGLLNSQSDRQRELLFKTLFPKIVPHVVKAWELLHRQPYQQLAFRKGFRAPTTPAVTALPRAHWLLRLLGVLGKYDQDIEWIAAWASHLTPSWAPSQEVSVLLAAAIDGGGQAGARVLEILEQSARGEHEIGVMGRHVPQALLISSNPEAWEFVEKLLLSAQREEGLRQVILESIDLSHPEAFRRMLRLILEHDLLRFSATVRAADAWFGFQWDSAGGGTLRQTLEKALTYLENPTDRQAALGADEAEPVYLALWAGAMEDVSAIAPSAIKLLDDPRAEHRFVAAYLLSAVNLNTYQSHMRRLMDDADLRTAAFGLVWQMSCEPKPEEHAADMAALERLYDRAPSKGRKLESIVWPWCVHELDKASVVNQMYRCYRTQDPLGLLKYLDDMEPPIRQGFAQMLGNQQGPEARATLIRLAGDASFGVRQSAIKALEKARSLDAGEAEHFEGLLTRKASDLRRGILTLLLKQKDGQALASADRLLGSKSEPQRAAGMELVRQLIEAGRSQKKCRQRLQTVQDSGTALSQRERVQIESAIGGEAEATRAYSLGNALGLIDPAQLTQAVKPKARPVSTDYRAAIACAESLDALVHEHRQDEMEVPTHRHPGMEAYDAPGDAVSEDSRTLILGEALWAFPQPIRERSPEEMLAALPLRDIWMRWYTDRPAKLRNKDGLELLRTQLLLRLPHLETDAREQLEPAMKALFGASKRPALQYRWLTDRILEWLYLIHMTRDAVDCLLDQLETALSLVPTGVIQNFTIKRPYGTMVWQNLLPLSTLIERLRQIPAYRPDLWKPEHTMRLWKCLHWMFVTGRELTLKEPSVEIDWYGTRIRVNREMWTPHPDEVYAAYRDKAISDADVLAFLFSSAGGVTHRFPLYHLTGRKEDPVLRKTPGLKELVEQARERILEVEMSRGEMATPASPLVFSLRTVYGADRALKTLDALAKGTLVRGYLHDNESRECVLSHLLRVAFPLDTDTPETFAERAKSMKIPEKRLIEMAVYAPQWAPFVEYATGYPGLVDGVWWLYAHTKDTAWHVDRDVREWWGAEVTERTPLRADDLLDGAVDVAWFWRAHDRLGAKTWKKLDAAAKYASSGIGHARARLFADALLDQVSAVELTERMLTRRHQDSVRALGLVPLPKEAGARQADVLARYKSVQEFLRASKKFGSQRQASEKRAAAIGMDNLARTAGYADPLRLQWAMERLLVADLAKGPVTVTEGEVQVTLSVDALGVPQIAVEKKGKVLASVPAAAKKSAVVKDLLDRKSGLKRQVSRMRKSLEGSMVRGDRFTGSELVALHEHPMLAPMLKSLVFTTDEAMGFPVEGGRALRGWDGAEMAVGPSEELRIVHPFDLLQTGHWDRWQRTCFSTACVQPFKQVFRELYVLTGAEREDRTISRRYAGHQVHPTQAVSLLGGRGWVAHPDGGVRQTFHDAGISAWLEGMEAYWTPAEIEGVTIEGVHFSKANSWESLSLESIPPRIFSEVMRDVDLVVSVAHRGGVDPEASASTVEMRSILIRETLQLLKIENVRIDGRRAFITGKHGEYAVHLSSAVAHIMPGGMLFIVPAGAQHRGRIFLPFADDDPKTAEVLSKIILLARDEQIKDPNILSQIRRE